MICNDFFFKSFMVREWITRISRNLTAEKNGYYEWHKTKSFFNPWIANIQQPLFHFYWEFRWWFWTFSPFKVLSTFWNVYLDIWISLIYIQVIPNINKNNKNASFFICNWVKMNWKGLLRKIGMWPAILPTLYITLEKDDLHFFLI